MIAQRNYDSIFVYICLGQRKPSKEICFYNCHTTLGMWCKRPLRQLWTEACHHCIGRVGVSCTGPLQSHNTSTQLCSWDLWVWLSTSDGSHGCSCLPSCLMICFYSRSTFDHLVFKNFLLVYGFFIQLFFIWLKENGIFEIWKMEKRNEDEYLLWQSYNFYFFWILLMFLYLAVLFLFNQYNIKLML